MRIAASHNIWVCISRSANGARDCHTISYGRDITRFQALADLRARCPQNTNHQVIASSFSKPVSTNYNESDYYSNR